jgi:predicted dehydrogenase
LDIKKQLNISIIGMGKMGLLHACILNSMPGVRVSTILDKSRLLKLFATKILNEIHITHSFDQFASSRYDAVYVTTPIPTHFSIIHKIFSLELTKNIFVEKTLCSTYEQSSTACREAKITGGVNMVGYMSRFAVTFQKAKELLEDRNIGNPVSFKAYAYASDFASIKGKPLQIKGGATRDLGAHVIDLSLWYFGELEVKSTTSIDENSSNFNVFSPNGLTGEFEISWLKEGYRLPEFGLVINGTAGRITVNTDDIKLEKNDSSFVWHRQDFNDNVPFLLAAPEYYRENAHFIEAIRQNNLTMTNFATASKVDLLIDQVEGRMYEK